MREIYIDASFPAPQNILWGYGGENNSAKLNIKLPSYMVGEKFNYKACFEDSLLKTSEEVPEIDSGICSLALTKDIATKGILKLQIVANSSKTPVTTSYKIRINGSPDKIQFFYTGGGTYNTLSRTSKDVSIESRPDKGYEIWTIRVKLADGIHNIQEKYGTQWVDNGVKLAVINEQVFKTPVIKLNIR